MQSWKDHFAAPLFDHNHNASFELQTVPEAYRAGRHILPRIFFDRNHNRKPRIPQIQSDEQSTTLVKMDLFIFRCKLRRFTGYLWRPPHSKLQLHLLSSLASIVIVSARGHAARNLIKRATREDLVEVADQYFRGAFFHDVPDLIIKARRDQAVETIGVEETLSQALLLSLQQERSVHMQVLHQYLPRPDPFALQKAHRRLRRNCKHVRV